MPLLGFEAQFAEAVATGRKRQTIRKLRKDGRDPKVGDRLHFYTGPYRPGERKKIGEATCSATGRIELRRDDADDRDVIYVSFHTDTPDRFPRGQGALTWIAKADGFPDVETLIGYVERTYGFPFEGTVTRWKSIET